MTPLEVRIGAHLQRATQREGSIMDDLKMYRHDKYHWLVALRSGKYTQTRGTLIRYDAGDGKAQHCCLGVLCEVVGLEDKGGEFLGMTGSLPPLVYRGVGLPSPNPVIPTGGSPSMPNSLGITLAELNDAGFTFDQIADVIEYFIEGVSTMGYRP